MLLNLPEVFVIIFLSKYYIEPSNGLFRSYRVKNIFANINKPKLGRRKVDDIFSLLSDINEPSHNVVEFKKNQAESYFPVISKNDQESDEALNFEKYFSKSSLDDRLKTNEVSSAFRHSFPHKMLEVHRKRKTEKILENIPVVCHNETEAANNQNVVNNILSVELNRKDPSTFKKYLNALSSVTHLNFWGSESFQDVIETVSKVSKIYDHEKEKLKTKYKHNKHKYPKKQYGILKSATKAISHLLDPPSIDVVLKKTKESKEEEEILKQVTSVILETEGRSGGYGHGSGLTLDPVTCIALVTLAAYLIRAIFQILTLTSTEAGGGGGRSLSGIDAYDKFLYNSDLPFTISNVFPNDTEDFPYKLAFKETNEKWFRDGLLKLPGEAVLAFKLLVDDQRPCLEEFICIHLKGRYFKNFGFSQLLWSSVALYDDFNISKLISKILLNGGDSCSKTQIYCGNKMNPEHCPKCPERDKIPPEKCPRCPTQTFNQYIQLQTLIHKLFEEYLHFNNYLS